MRRYLCVLFLLIGSVTPQLFGQAIMGTFGDGSVAVAFPTPNTGLPTPTQTNVSGMPSGAAPHGVSYFGSDSGLVSDFGNSRVEVVKISTASVTATIPTPSYNGTGTIAVAPDLQNALANGTTTTLNVIHAPFNASSSITTVTLPATIRSYQTEAIVFNAAGRAFVYHTSGISVLDPPYTSIAFTIPVSNASSGSIAITPDGSTLLTTNLASNIVLIFSAPFSAGSLPVSLSIGGATALDGIAVTPDGSKALVVNDQTLAAMFAISAPYTAASTVQAMPLPAGFPTSTGFEDIGISADGQLAIATGNSATALPALFVRAPFTTAGATSFSVTVNGPGRGTGAVRFLPAGLAPGLTITKVANPSPVPSGSQLVYTITYGNTGAANASSVVIKDTVPAGTTFVSATNGGTQSGGVVTFTIGTVTAGTTNQTVSFTVNVTASSGSSVSNNNYTIEGTGVSPISGPPVTTSVAAPSVSSGLIPALSLSTLALLGFALAVAGALMLKVRT